MKKFAVHPGYVFSENDGDRHWISGQRLVNLYELQPNEYVIWGERTQRLDWDDYRHLYPRRDGRYGRPRDE